MKYKNQSWSFLWKKCVIEIFHQISWLLIALSQDRIYLFLFFFFLTTIAFFKLNFFNCVHILYSSLFAPSKANIKMNSYNQLPMEKAVTTGNSYCQMQNRILLGISRPCHSPISERQPGNGKPSPLSRVVYVGIPRSFPPGLLGRK